MRHLVVKELVAHLKNGWIVVMGLVCAALSWFIGAHGFAFTGGQVQAQTLLVSIVHLQLYIVPLLGLLLAYDAVLDERVSGMFDLHLALGLRKTTFVAGKWIGLLVSLWVSLMPSLAVQAWSLFSAGVGVRTYVFLLGYAGLLSGAIISIGLLLSSLSLNRSTVVSFSVGIWLLLAVLLDFAAIALLAFTQGDAPDWLVNGLIMANPLGLYRLLSYLAFFPDQVETLLNVHNGSAVFAVVALVGWIFAPVLAMLYRLSRVYRPISETGGEL
jgi:Cu-processing system permease protein